MEARIRLKKRILAQTIQTETDLEAGIQAAFAPISQNGSGDLSSPRTFFADAGVQFHLFAPSRTHASFQPRIGAGWALAGNSLSTVRLSPYLTHLYTGPQLYLSSLFQPLGMPEFEMSVSFLPWAESVGSPSSRLSRWSVGGRIPLQKRAGISPWSLGVEYFGSQAAGGPADENYQLTGISTELRFSL